MDRWTIGMRDAFSQELYDEATRNSDVLLVTADTGAICHDKFRPNILQRLG